MLAAAIAASATATAHLLDTETDWCPELSELLLGPSSTHLAAPAHRFCSAQQGALMLREGPRLPAVGCETGDWSHVDVYLTKTTDYRLLVFAGSQWEPQLAEWTTSAEAPSSASEETSPERGTTCAIPVTPTTSFG